MPDLTAVHGHAPSNIHSLEKQRTMPVEVQKLLRQSRVEQQEKEARPGREGTRSKGKDQFVARNWKELSAKELAAMPRVAQSRYQAVSHASHFCLPSLQLCMVYTNTCM